MVGRYKFRGVDIRRTSQIVLLLPFIIIPLSCAPTISGSLVPPENLEVRFDNARINVTSIASQQLTSYVLPVDSNGHFHLSEKLKKGRYVIEALVPGFQIAGIEVNLDDSQTVKIELTPLAKSPTKTIGINLNLDESRGTGGATLTPPSM